ncbi:hypothetical protein ACFL6C_07280 [Myxococcota bacterium]
MTSNLVGFGVRQSSSLRVQLVSAVVVTAVMALPDAAEAAWYDAGWSFRKQITLDRAQVVGGPHTDFPVLISITGADLAAKARSDGSDIFFTQDDGSTLLDFEIEAYVSATGTLVTMYVYYGNASPPAPPDPANVWSGGYALVLHMSETPTVDAYAYDSRPPWVWRSRTW